MESNFGFKCPNCDSLELVVLRTNKKTGLFCTKCGTRVRWLNSNKEISEAYQRTIQPEEVRGKAIKMIVKFGRITNIKCEKCGCLLYSSGAEKPLGQFDLIGANYCPQCGSEFVESQKQMAK